MKIANGTVAWITGGSAGIGLEIARALAARGATVALSARREPQLREAASRIPGAAAYPLDVTDGPAVQRIADAIAQKHGRLDILVNNAGILLYKPMAECSMEEVRRVMEVNFFAQAACARAVLPIMARQKRGHIVNMASLAGRIGFPNLGYYSASKFALTGFSETLRQEAKPLGISVSLIHPGTVETPMTQAIVDAARAKGKRVATIRADAVARAVVRAIERGSPEVFAPFAGRMLYWLHAACPPLAEWLAWKFRAADPDRFTAV